MSVPLEELERGAQRVANLLEQLLNPPTVKLPPGSYLRRVIRGPRRIGFVVWLFDFSDSGFATYISNGDRADMVKALREMLAKIEGHEPSQEGQDARGGQPPPEP